MNRGQESDITRLQTRSSSGGMVPLASVVTLHDTTVPYRVVRYNMYPTAELQGATAPGYSSGQGLATASAARIVAWPGPEVSRISQRGTL